MNRVSIFRLSLTVSLTCAFLVLGYELKDRIPGASGSIKLIAILCGLLFAPQFAAGLTRLALSLKRVRQFVLGKAWIEGTWIMTTYEDGKKIASGLSQVAYIGPSCEIQVQIYFPNSIRGGGPSFSTSTSVLLRETDLLYMNYFTSAGANSNFVGVAVGNFFIDQTRSFPKRYEGKVFYIDRGTHVRQIGIKLADRKVRDFIEKYGDAVWMNQILNTEEPQHLFAESLESDVHE